MKKSNVWILGPCGVSKKEQRKEKSWMVCFIMLYKINLRNEIEGEDINFEFSGLEVQSSLFYEREKY